LHTLDNQGRGAENWAATKRRPPKCSGGYLAADVGDDTRIPTHRAGVPKPINSGTLVSPWRKYFRKSLNIITYLQNIKATERYPGDTLPIPNMMKKHYAMCKAIAGKRKTGDNPNKWPRHR
jgi:hypothetical protein